MSPEPELLRRTEPTPGALYEQWLVPPDCEDEFLRRFHYPPPALKHHEQMHGHRRHGRQLPDDHDLTLAVFLARDAESSFDGIPRKHSSAYWITPSQVSRLVDDPSVILLSGEDAPRLAWRSFIHDGASVYPRIPYLRATATDGLRMFMQ